MKMSPEFVRAQANMQPGVITSAGFLGEDNRQIVEIISGDEQTMQRHGLEFDAVVERMHHLLDEGRKGLGEPITVDGTWLVQVFEARGFLASPFEDGIFRKINAEVRLIQDGRPSEESILFSELSIHLVEKYHFLQGHGSPFRLEPAQIERLLFPAR